MARHPFGGSAADFLFTATAGIVRLATGTLTFWDAETGGTQHTDLLLDGNPVTAISVGNDGQIPTFSGPDGVTQMWVDAGDTRVVMVSIAGVAEEVNTARDQATTARNQAETAAASVRREQVGGVAGLDAAGKVYETRIPTRLATSALNKAFAARTGSRVALLGASITANNGDSTLVNNPVGGATAHGPSTLGIARWANMLLGQAMEVITNVSAGGLTSAQILTNVPAALAGGPDWVIGHDWWINDIVTGVSSATSKANIEAIITACNQAGAGVILTDYLPLTAYDSPAKVAQHFAMMDWLQARGRRGFTLLPVCDLITDPASGKPLAWATTDGSHPSARGAHAMGRMMAQRLSGIFANRLQQPVAISALSNAAYFGNPRELALNPPPFATVGAGMAYGLSASGSGTPTGSRVACTDSPGVWQRITFGADGAVAVILGLATGAGLTYTGPGGSLTLTPGVTRTQMQFEFRIPAASAAGKWVDVTGYMFYAPNSDAVYALQDTAANGQDQGYAPDDARTYVARSPAWVMPAGSTAINAALVLYGQAGAVVDLRRLSVAVVD